MCRQGDAMHDFWSRSLLDIYQGFLRDLSSMERYCELCEVSFHEGGPNYRSGIQQELYLLRYFSAYFFEYFEAFSRLAASIPPESQIVSFGCGSGIDGAAARFALPSCSYLGVDQVEWNSWFSDHPRRILCASEFIPVAQNVFVFPKSLSEFPDSVVRNLANNLPQTQASDVWIINSRRSMDSPCDEKCRTLLRAFGCSDFAPQYEIAPRQSALINYWGWFQYPQEIINRISGLSSRCPDSERCEILCRCGHCRGWQTRPMERHPVLKDVNFCTQIYRVRRA